MSGEINWQTLIGNVSAVPSYSKTSASGKQSQLESDGTTTSWTLDDSNVQKGAELRMTNASDFTLFEWIFGGTYYESTQKRTQEYASGSVDTGMETLNKKKALYANITYPLWFYERLKLTLGYRQSWDENLSWENNGASQSGNPEGYNKPDLKYGFQYEAADNMMLYGSFSSSYRSANAMGQPDASGEIPDPEELDAYALGMKSRWFDNKVQVNVNAYYYDYANKLGRGFKEETGLTEEDFGYDAITASTNDRGDTTATLEPDGEYPTMYDSDGDGVDDTIYTFKLNDPNSQGSGAFTSLGLDLQTNWVVTSRDRVNFSIAYLDSKWETLKFHYYWYMIFPDEDYKNVTPTNSPKWSMTASYEHNFMLWEYGTLTPRIDAQYKSEYEMVWNYEYGGDPYDIGHQEAYTLYDASAVFNHASGRWSLSAYVKNITNYAVKRSYMGMGQMSLMIGDPRTYGASFSIRF